MRCLEEQQDEFDFKYQTHQMDGEISLPIHQSLSALTSLPVSYFPMVFWICIVIDMILQGLPRLWLTMHSSVLV